MEFVKIYRTAVPNAARTLDTSCHCPSPGKNQIRQRQSFPRTHSTPWGGQPLGFRCSRHAAVLVR